MDEANEVLNIALNARNLAIAERAGLDLLTICSTCQGMLSLANLRLTDAKVKSRVDGALKPIGIEYRGTTKVKHLLQVLVQDVGLPGDPGEGSSPPRGPQGRGVLRVPPAPARRRAELGERRGTALVRGPPFRPRSDARLTIGGASCAAASPSSS